jgi:hypothetical protein
MPKYDVTFREEQYWHYTYTVEADSEIDATALALSKWEEGTQAEDSYIENAYSTPIPEFVCLIED